MCRRRDLNSQAVDGLSVVMEEEAEQGNDESEVSLLVDCSGAVIVDVAFEKALCTRSERKKSPAISGP
jgi:hypothetical protein